MGEGGGPNKREGRGGGKINGIHNRLSICHFSLATLDVSRGGWVGFKGNVTMTFLVAKCVWIPPLMILQKIIHRVTKICTNKLLGSFVTWFGS